MTDRTIGSPVLRLGAVVAFLGVVVVLWHLGRSVGLPQAPLVQQVAAWALVVVSRDSRVQQWLGGGDLAGRPWLSTFLGCALFGAALGGAGLPFLLPGATGIVVASHLLWTGERAWRPGVVAAGTCTLVVELGVQLGVVPSALPTGLSHVVAVAGLIAAIATTVSVRLLVALRDASHQERQTELARAAHRDQLTGLLNRTGLADHLAGVARSSGATRGTAVVFCDLDGFKAVNDTHGHGAGDAVLVAVAGRLQAALGGEDCLARVGGDEFVAVLADVPGAVVAERVAARLRAALDDPVSLDGLALSVGVSVGVAWVAGDARPSDLLREADDAMYREKRRSRVPAR